MFVRSKTYNKALAEIEQLKGQVDYLSHKRSVDSARVLKPIEKDFKRFLKFKLKHSKSLDNTEKVFKEVWKWLLNNL